ncbi:hypothetical protein Taro_040921 [Colocasia esculenta]|uniref:Mitogen-activated protein kinase kinase kinase 1 n=1 Tax=Colocasia esculenta TaxID=4460 RepID=A0A843WEF6_COLES|nr:hypothetical protein [Colocasia esculenta]
MKNLLTSSGNGGHPSRCSPPCLRNLPLFPFPPASSSSSSPPPSPPHKPLKESFPPAPPLPTPSPLRTKHKREEAAGSRPTTSTGGRTPMEESVGSNSPPPSPVRRRRRPPNPAQQLADRIDRAFHHRLRLLHRSGTAFFVLGATGNVYVVTLSAEPPSCTCPDRAPTPCKHTLFVLLRVLGLPPDAACLRRRAPLHPPQLRRLLDAPTPPEALAGFRARERFHQLFSSSSEAGGAQGNEKVREPEGTCPVCLEEMEERKLATCGACGNSVHEECFLRWKRSRGRRAASCVMCRARWRERKEQEAYVNLAPYASEDEVATGGEGSCAG